MCKNQNNEKRLDQVVVKSMASVARGIAKDSIEGRCFLFFHQPEEPKNLAERLEKMSKN